MALYAEGDIGRGRDVCVFPTTPRLPASSWITYSPTRSTWGAIDRMTRNSDGGPLVALSTRLERGFVGGCGTSLSDRI